jgi:hypothetical protein
VIVWSGWGILALLLAAAGGGGGTAIGETLGGAADHANPGTSVGLVVAAVAIWLVGRRLNRPLPGYHPRTGEKSVFGNRHRFFFLPMHYWGPIVGAAAAIQALRG